MRTIRLFLLACVSACCVGPRGAAAQVSLPALLSDHMVLQQQADVALWGHSDRHRDVVVVTSWDHREYRTSPDAQGRWKLFVRTPKAGGPYDITFDDGARVTLKDVLIGEVWLCSGQSNMVSRLSRSDGGDVAVRQADIPDIRYFKVARQFGEEPFDDAPGSVWVPASPDTAGSFSAVAFYFARTLHQKTRVPVGIIEADWGGTSAEAWTPRPVLRADPALRIDLERWATWKRDSAKAGPAGKLAVFMTSRPHREPGVLFNGMIDPVIPFTLKGFLWYQGESNVRWAGEYEHLLTRMVEGWRNRWNEGQKSALDLPFYIVQLPPFGYSDMEGASIVREAQQHAAERVGHSGIAVTVDVGEMKNIHPSHKREVGERLARLALVEDYGFDDLAESGPVYRRAVAEGSRLRLYFDHTDGGLRAGNGSVTGFEISSESQPSVFREAHARIDGRTVVVWRDDVGNPAAVRYGWGDRIEQADLFNGAGLPAAPFRSTAAGGSPREN